VITKAGNLFADVSDRREAEDVAALVTTAHLRIERIVSHAHASPPGFWYDQDWAEWVLVVAGAARLLIAGENVPRELKPGDYVLIPPHVRHRVASTSQNEPTIGLAIHYG
jgi:cupin 2 domain-containing protein